jgi:acetoin utilization protein AcuA
LMYEMAALEVSRNYRHLQIAGRMFGSMMEDDFYEDKIAYMCGYSWHWDLEGTGLSMIEYRNMMLQLLRGHGFKEHVTNEPNITLRQENFFMARVGSRVSEEDRRRFRDLRFGITWR